MLITRVVTALALVPLVVLGILFLPTVAIALIFAALMLLGAWEWGGLLRLAQPGRTGFVVAVAVVMGLVALLCNDNFALGAENLFIGLACLWWLAAIYWVMRFPDGWAATIGRRDIGLLVGVIALVAPVAAITYLHQSDDGALLLLTFFFLIWAADTGAYFAGRTLGRHKLAPRVSPGKTREGAVGGVVAAVLLAWVGAWVLGYDATRTLAFMFLGGWIALISIVGDLTISMFKRHAQLKDSGRLFPGHGGVLDRLDSVLAAAPWFVAGLHWLPSQF
ncbi:phosphatidate cytidylyltransferase [Salinisphaera aquimarina]|uniref:Phosphatidate cytidylyltransferase n=1 Tax=Salinisphaera aquimarina TaxID=2094031 RepID=A0ABV7ESP9_9GAMM